MLTPTHLSVALLLLLGTADTAASRAVATYYIPEKESPEHKPVTIQLQALGINRYTPPNEPTDLWAQVPAHQADIDLVWSAEAAPPPFDKLSFPSAVKTKINHVPGSNARLTDSDAFYKHIYDNQRQKETFFFNYVPKHLVLPRDQAEMPKVFAETAKRVENELKREDDEFIYQRFLVREQPVNGNEEALQPAAVITNNEDLLATINANHQGKNVEVTQYIEPYLIDGHKFQVGFYVVITSIDPLRIYYYGHPQIKIAKTPYPTRLKKETDKSAYNFKEFIAPWDFPDLQHLYFELPSVERPGTNSWTVLKRYMMMQGLDTTRLQKEMEAAIATSIISSRGYFQSQIRKLHRSAGQDDVNKGHTELDDSFFELMRFDFELDDLGKPWLTRIHSNPSVVPHTTVFGTDEAVKNGLLFDLFNLVGVHPQAKPSFDEVFVPANAEFCAAKCKDDSRVWDSTCWSCPGGFSPYVARRLFDAKNEYARRGNFKLVFPSMDQDYTKFLDNALSEYDTAFTRYIKSLSVAYADMQDVPVFNNVLTCAYREHCSGNGDCVNGKCVCDEAYEGATCYIPKDMEQEKRAKEERAVAEARAKESWMGNLWNRGGGAPVPAPMAKGNTVNNQAQELSQSTGSSSGGLVFGILFVGIFGYGGYHAYVAHSGGVTTPKSK